MTTIEQMKAHVGKRARYLGSYDPDPDMKAGQEGTALFVDELDRLIVEWDGGDRVSLMPCYDSWEIIPEGEASDDSTEPPGGAGETHPARPPRGYEGQPL